MFEFAWSTYRRKVITVCALITGVTGAIIGVAKAAPIIEPWWYASRAYVRDITDLTKKTADDGIKKLEAISRDTQVELAEGKRDNVAGKIFEWTVEKNKTTDENLKIKFQEEINRLTATQEKLNQQINTLNAVKQRQ